MHNSTEHEISIAYKNAENKRLFLLLNYQMFYYYIPINDTSFVLSVFWIYDTESWINELRFSDSVLLSFKTRLMSVTCFAVA